MKKFCKAIGVIIAAIGFNIPLFAQVNTCDTAAMNTYLSNAGFVHLYVPQMPCSRYYYNPTQMYGIDAHRTAANLGIPQLIIDSAFEDSVVSTALYTQGAYGFSVSEEVWLGITDSSTAFTWRTFDGSALPTYTNWDPGEPNNLSPACKIGTFCTACLGVDAYWCAYGEDCAVMNANSSWLDITCEGSGRQNTTVLEVNTCPVLIPPTDMTICAGTPTTFSAGNLGGTGPFTYTWNHSTLTGQTVSLSPSANDTVTITLSDTFHCSADTSFVISVIHRTASAPIVSAPGRDTLTTTSYTSYQWLLNGAPLAGDTAASYIARANGPYQVVVIDSNGCIDTSKAYIVTGVGISEIAGQGDISLYPNPNNGSFILQSNSSIGQQCIIYDMTGRTVARQTITSNKQSIELKGLSPGEYTLEIKGNNNRSIRFSVEN